MGKSLETNLLCLVLDPNRGWFCLWLHVKTIQNVKKRRATHLCLGVWDLNQLLGRQKKKTLRASARRRSRPRSVAGAAGRSRCAPTRRRPPGNGPGWGTGPARSSPNRWVRICSFLQGALGGLQLGKGRGEMGVRFELHTFGWTSSRCGTMSTNHMEIKNWNSNLGALGGLQLYRQHQRLLRWFPIKMHSQVGVLQHNTSSPGSGDSTSWHGRRPPNLGKSLFLFKKFVPLSGCRKEEREDAALGPK